MPRWGLLLVNLGTPASPTAGDVRRYLREFLADPRVLDIPAPLRWLLLHLVILPFRPARSAEAYAKVWTDRGSPLLVHSQDLTAKVAARLGPDVPVRLAMRYQEPSLAGALEALRAADVERVVVLPLYPQYAASSTGSTLEAVFRLVGERWNVPALRVVPPFHDHPGFLDAFAAAARPVIASARPDVVLMSFHGLPERQVKKSGAPGHCLASASCCDALGPANRACYRAQCMATARALAARLGLSREGPARYEVTFQSRLGRTPWIQPFTDVRVVELAQAGTKRVVVLCPAFVADCLETLEEIGLRLRDDFLAHGGESLELAPSVNADDAWADAVITMARDAAGDWARSS